MFFRKVLFIVVIILCRGLYSQCLQSIIVLDENGGEISNYEVITEKQNYKCLAETPLLSLKKGTAVTIKNKGYIPYKIILTGKAQKVYLQRDESSLELDPMVVTGTRSLKPLSESAVYTRIISNKDIISSGATNLKNVLEREIPSITFTYHAGVPNIKMHGMGDNRVLILINGERIAGETHNNIDYSQIDINDIDRVEIVQGASSTLYGSGAIGGVINIITKKKKQNNLSLSSVYNSNKVLKNSLIGNLNLGKIWLKTGVRFDMNEEVEFKDRQLTKYIYDDGTIEQGGKLYSNYLRAQKLWSVRQGVGYKVNDNLSLSLDLNHYEKYQKRIRKEKFVIQDNFYSTGAIFNIDWKKNHWEHQLSYNYNYYTKEYEYLRINEKEQRYKNNIHYARYLLNYKIEDLGWLNGVEYTKEGLKTYMFLNSEPKYVYTLSAFSELDWQFVKDFYFLGGMRVDKHQFFGEAVTPKIAFKHKIYKNINARWSFSTGFRAPTLKELYTDWDHLGMFRIIGNKNLKPERSINYMTTIEKEGKVLYASVSFFKTNVSQKLGLQWKNIHKDTLVYHNYDRQKLWGVDFISKIRLLHNLKLKMGYSYTYNKTWQDGHNLSDTRPYAFNFDVNYDFAPMRNYNINLSCNGNYYSGMSLYSSDENKKYYKTQYPAYFLLNLNTIFRYKKYISINLGAENILNYSPDMYDFYTPMLKGVLYKAGLNINLN